MKDRSRTQRDNLIRLSFWGTLLLLGVFVYLDANPIALESEETSAPGSKLSLEAVSDILVVIDYDAYPTQPEAFSDLDFSLAWVNTFHQEVGPVAVQDANAFTNIELSNFRVVVITRSASGNDTWVQKLQGFVDRGGTLVLEMPQSGLRSRFSADGQGGERSPQHITMARDLPDELMAALMDVPVESRLIGSAGPLEGSETLMTVDGVPVVYRKAHGKGWAITVDFDYGMLLTALQQGRPTDGFRIRNQRGTDQVETADLALYERLEDAEIPIADVLERFMLYGVIDKCAAMVGFWPFLDGMDGALVVSHDERGLGDPTTWMAEYEHSFQGSSTYTIRANGEITASGLEELTALGVDIGLEWNRVADGDTAATERFGFLGIEPVTQTLTLDEQLELLLSLFPDMPPPETVRLRDHVWGRDWTEPFRVMSTTDLRADASYAPLPGKGGYLFGTGLPFMPIDRTGLAFRLLELPLVLVATGERQELERLAHLLKRSHDTDHQALGVSFSPADFYDNPSAHLFKSWHDGYQLAAEQSHWITSVHNFYRFSRARHSSELKAKRVRTQVEGRETHLLRIETLALETGMFCTAPAALGDHLFQEARRGVNRATGEDLLRDVLETRTVDVSGHERILIPLNKGYNAIDIVYH